MEITLPLANGWLIGQPLTGVNVVEAVVRIGFRAAEDYEFRRTPDFDHLRVCGWLNTKSNSLSLVPFEKVQDEAS
ncbi:MAG: hypothetical protein WEB67_10140, partial [Acidimicrobiia bacterium]